MNHSQPTVWVSVSLCVKLQPRPDSLEADATCSPSCLFYEPFVFWESINPESPLSGQTRSLCFSLSFTSWTAWLCIWKTCLFFRVSPKKNKDWRLTKLLFTLPPTGPATDHRGFEHLLQLHHRLLHPHQGGQLSATPDVWWRRGSGPQQSLWPQQGPGEEE